MNKEYLLLLAGGVGAAKFIDGLANIINPNLMKIIVNTGDDIELFGLKICPDLDIITYTLANLVDREKGWGFEEETFNSLSILKNYYDYGWFNIGDKDLATHIFRTDLFKSGYSKAEITSIICDKLGIKAQVIPMCNQDVQTFIKTNTISMHFEEYFIKYRCEPEVIDIEFKGIKDAKPIKGVLSLIKEAKKIIFCPSNPIVSIGTILQVAGIKETLKKVRNKVFAITPIIQGAPIKGPADKLMKVVNLEVSCVGVASYYKDVIGHFIIDEKDCALKPRIEKLGIKTYCHDTIMSNLKKKKDLAKFIVEITE